MQSMEDKNTERYALITVNCGTVSSQWCKSPIHTRPLHRIYSTFTLPFGSVTSMHQGRRPQNR